MVSSSTSSDQSKEFSVFATSNFDPNDYANSILSGETYPSAAQNKKTSTRTSATSEAAKEDISVALTKLNTSIEDVTKQLRSVVTTHHEALLSEAASVHDLEGSLQTVRQGLVDIETSLEKLRLKIRVPYQSLAAHVKRLERFQLAVDVLRRTSRFVLVSRRLELQMADLERVNTPAATKSPNDLFSPTKDVVTDDPTVLGQEGERERTLAKAALSIAELVSLTPAEPKDGINMESADAVPPISLRSISAITRHLPAVESARTKVTEEMENMVQTGLVDVNQSMLASALQTAHNLRVLPYIVQDIVDEITQHVDARIRFAFDLGRISKEATGKEPPAPSTSLMYRSRVRTEPTNATAPQWANALWASLETLVEELTASCIKVYSLEKVLKLKKDTVLKTPFLDEAMKSLENRPTSTFWMTAARGLEIQCRESAKGSSFVQQTLSNGYPKLLRLFQDFFSKIGVYTDTVYTESHQSPETVLVLRAVSNFEALYLSRSQNRLNEAVGSAVSGGTRAPPSSTEGMAVARTIVNELDSARFDPLLVRSVAKNVATSLEMFVSRVEAMFARDRASISLVGPTSTPQQALNAQLVSALYSCWLRLSKLDEEYHASVFSIFEPAIKTSKKTYDRMYEPLLTAIRRDLSSTITKLHRVDFSKAFDPSAGMGGGSSPYMKEIVEKLTFIRSEVFSKYAIGDLSREWIISIAQKVIRNFILHASIAKPLGESGKLQLTSDMTALEFALSAFVHDGGAQKRTSMKLDVVADDYRALRALRPLLFCDNTALESPDQTTGLPTLVVLHHILVRSPLPLPHEVHGWRIDEYVRWVDEHTEQEALTLLDGCLTRWQSTAGQEDLESGREYFTLARNVLNRAISE